MSNRIKSIVTAISQSIGHTFAKFGGSSAHTAKAAQGATLSIGALLLQRQMLISGLTATAAVGYGLYTHPPVRSVEAGDAAVRINRTTSNTCEWRDGTVMVVPGLHQWRTLHLRDQTYRPGGKDGAEAACQLVEALSFGADLVICYAVDATKIEALAKLLQKISKVKWSSRCAGRNLQSAGALHHSRNFLVEAC